jgi:hypothetical protein
MSAVTNVIAKSSTKQMKCILRECLVSGFTILPETIICWTSSPISIPHLLSSELSMELHYVSLFTFRSSRYCRIADNETNNLVTSN